MSRAIAHIDLDAFFAAVEVLERPELRGKPLIIGAAAEMRGVVSTASYEARKFGVHSGQPMAQALRLCPQAILCPPRGQRYGEISRQVFAIMERYTPLVEPVSVDEAFLDLTGTEKLWGPPEQTIVRIVEEIHAQTGLTASVGLAENKFLAKMASDMDKPAGVTIVKPGTALDFLGPLPAGKLWGVGKQTAAQLRSYGIELVRELWEKTLPELVEILGPASAGHLYRIARGQDARPVTAPREHLSISHETTFHQDVGDEATLTATLDRLVEKVAHRARRHGQWGSTLHLKARYGDFSTVTRTLALPSPTDSSVRMLQGARELFWQRLPWDGRALRLIGFGLGALETTGHGQLSLFDEPTDEAARSMDAVIDRVGEKYGKEVLYRASSLGWVSKQKKSY